MEEYVSNERDSKKIESTKVGETGALARAIHEITSSRKAKMGATTSQSRQGTDAQSTLNGTYLINELETRLAEKFASENNLWFPFETVLYWFHQD